jgi:23S rRNA (cytosine1962-C5)-methyltransferase
MTKPRTLQSFTPKKAPKASSPEAPFEANRKNSAPAQRSTGRDSGTAAKPKVPSTGLSRPSIQRNRPHVLPPGRRADLGRGALINRRAADRLRSGHLWVYASDIESLELPAAGSPQTGSPETGDLNPPSLLPVADSRGLLLGTALYSPTSQIALRLVSREAIDETTWLDLLASRLRGAIGRRKRLLDSDTDSCRLCFSEADELPGLVIDKYGDLVILQLVTKGLDTPAVRETCVRVLREEVAPVAILERPDPRMRDLEGLAAPSDNPLFVASDRTPTTSTQFRLNGLLFEFDANSGQKTGAFLDQRANYAAARGWAQRLGKTGRALDVCCYQGGFALHLAQVCGQVTGIDASRASLEVAERNFAANRASLNAQVDWVEADAFHILRDWSDSGETFDTIVLDPPAFAKTQRAVEGALRGYKELNLRALKMIRPGGLLVTCSCSHHVGWTELEASVVSAAVDVSRRVRLLERRGAALDHPVVLNLPETEYLKCLVLEVE